MKKYINIYKIYILIYIMTSTNVVELKRPKSRLTGLYQINTTVRRRPAKNVFVHPDVYVKKKTCDTCGQSKPLIDFPGTAYADFVGKTRNKKIEELFGSTCLSCLKRKVMVQVLHSIIDQQKNLNDAQKAAMKSKVENLILVQKKDIRAAKQELGLQDKILWSQTAGAPKAPLKQQQQRQQQPVLKQSQATKVRVV
jgi:hypothetical protein